MTATTETAPGIRDLVADQLTEYRMAASTAKTLLAGIGQPCECEDGECECPSEEQARAEADTWSRLALAAATAMQALTAVAQLNDKPA